MAIDFREHLGKQLSFLERSCAAYDAGFEEEAIRIATVLRVLLYSTKSQVPLLQHLDAMNTELLSTIDVPRLPAEVYKQLGMDPNTSWNTAYMTGLVAFTISSDGQVKCHPSLDVGTNPYYLPVAEWLGQLAQVMGAVRLTRRDIILTAADRDGGAHVDSKLTPEYEHLMADGALGVMVREPGKPSSSRFVWASFFDADPRGTGSHATALEGPQTHEVVDVAKGAHLVALRKMGFEILNSPQLMALKAN
jgi:hypothetical protein